MTGAGVTDAAAVADAVAAEVGLEGRDRDALRPFEPIALDDVSSVSGGERGRSTPFCC